MKASTFSYIRIGGRLLRSGVMSVISMVVTMVIGFMLTPMIVRTLGERMYGAWVLIGALLGYFGLLDLGLSQAVTRFVSQSLGAEDRKSADGWISAGVILFSIAAMVGLVLTGLAYILCRSFVTNASELPIFRVAIVLTGLAFSLSLPTRCFEGILTAHVRRDVVSYIQLFTSLGRAGLVVYTIKLGGSFLSLVSIAAFILLVQGVLLFLAARIVHGAMRISIKNVNWEIVKRLLDFSAFSFVSQIADIARFRTAPLIITAISGLAGVSPFALGDQLTSAISGICSQVLTNMTPVFSQMEGAKGNDQLQMLRRVYFLSYKASCYMGVFAVGCGLMFSVSFVHLWIGDNYANMVPIVQILLVGILFGLVQIPTICLLFGLSRHRFYTYSNMFQALLSVGLSIVLGLWYGVIGVAIGISVSMFVVKLFVQPFGATRVLDMEIIGYHLRHTLPNLGLPTMFWVAVVIVVRQRIFSISSYFDIMIYGLCLGIIYILYIGIVGLSMSERRSIWSILLLALGVQRAA